MAIDTMTHSQMGEGSRKFLPPIISSLQEGGTCPSDVIARLKEYENSANTFEDLPEDLRWLVSIVMERDDALVQSIKHQEAAQKLNIQLVQVQQEKEEILAREQKELEAGLRLSELCDKYCEDWKSECCRHYTSGSENASNIEGVEDPDENSKEPKTQNADRERLGEYFRRRYEEAADETASSERKSSSKSGKRQETAAESTGEDLLTHSGEEDLWEPTSGGYDELEKYVEEVRKKTSAAPDGTREPWARCKVGHMDAVVGNIRASEVYYTITGDPLSGECPPQNLELSGLSFRLTGYEVIPEIEMIPATAVLVKHIYPKYKVSLNGLEAEDRVSALVKLQELLGPDICVDGAKTAFEIVSVRMRQDSPGEDEEAACGNDQTPDLLSEENVDSGDTDISGEKPEGSDDRGEEQMSPLPSVEGQDNSNNAGRPEKKSPAKISRRQQNKERNQRSQVKTASDKEEEEAKRQEEARKKEEQAQVKRERERQKHAQKKQEEVERKKAENPDYEPSKKRSKQRNETFVRTSSSKKQDALISGKSYWSPTLVAYILFLSVMMMLPIYRIECASPALLGGLNIPLSTLESLSIMIFSKKLKYLLPYFYKVLNEQHYIHADETVIEVFREKFRKNVTKSYIWIYSTTVSCSTQVRIYDYKPGRKGEFCKAVLASFTGVLITDAYQGYNLVDGVQHAFCFIHARRKIYDAAQNGSSRYARKLAWRVLTLIDELFAIERKLQAAGYDPETLAKKRMEQMSGILTVLKDTLIRMQKDKRISSNGKLAKAVNYMLGHYDELTYFLKDGNVPMHNQVSEQAARRVALYRNNSLFCGSPAGADAFAGILTVVETARANNLDVYKYLVFLFENMRGNDFWKDEERMLSLLPWSEKAQAECASKNPVKEQKIRLLGGQVAV